MSVTLACRCYKLFWEGGFTHVVSELKNAESPLVQVLIQPMVAPVKMTTGRFKQTHIQAMAIHQTRTISLFFDDCNLVLSGL